MVSMFNLRRRLGRGPALGVVACLVFSCLINSHARAGFETGNSIIEKCTSSNIFHQGYCLGYLAGVYDNFILYSPLIKLKDVKDVKLCVPAGVTLSQIRDISIKWSKIYPEIRNESAATLIVLSLDKAFPCPKP
jgi:hypothetical protein